MQIIKKENNSKPKANLGSGKPSPVLISKNSMHSNVSDKMHAMTIAETPSLIGHVTPNVKYSYSKADHLNYTKPTYIILTIDTDSKQKLSDYDRIRQIDNASGSGEKTYINKKDTPKSTINSLSSTTFNKQGQSYQQLSSLKNMHKPSHVRTKSDHILKAKPAINFMKPSKVKLGSSGVKKPKKATDKPPKDKLSHRRVRSDIIGTGKNVELFSEHLYQQSMKMQKKSVVKPPELLKHSNSSKNNVQIKQISSVYSNKIIPASFTTRVMTVPKKASRVNYISVTNSVKSPTKNAQHSPTGSKHQSSVVSESSATHSKTIGGGHVKNSLSTQLKKDDMEEFPSSTYHKMSNKKEHNKENQEDSAVFKYKEYKKLYFQETKPEKQKKQNNYVTEQIEEKDELLNFPSSNKANSRRKKNKSDY